MLTYADVCGAGNKFNYRYFALTIADFLWDSPHAQMHRQAVRDVAAQVSARMLTYADRCADVR